MCTNFVIVKSQGVVSLSERLGVDAESMLYHSHVKPGMNISIITGGSNDRTIRPATWWLYLRQTPAGLSPDPDYFSVNTNYRKLGQKPEFRTRRCLVPATAFMESQNGKAPHLLEPENGDALAFGGLWKEWVDKTTGEIKWSSSIITLPGHPTLSDIHKKSTPLLLTPEDFESWLDPGNTDIDAFNYLLKPRLPVALKATPIDKVGKRNPIGEPRILPAD